MFDQIDAGSTIDAAGGKGVMPMPSGDYRRYALIGLIVVIAVFGVFGIWAATAPLSGAVIAEGQLAVSSNTKTVQHQEGGIVRAIRVGEGDVVGESDVLIELDRTQRASEVQTTRARLLTNTAVSARLQAEAEGAESIEFPSTLHDGPVPGIDVEQIRTTQRILFEARRATLASQLGQHTQRIEQLGAQISGLREVMASVEEQIASYSEEVREWSDLYEDDLTDKQQLREARRRQLELEGERAAQRSEIVRLRSEIQASQASRTLTQNEYDREVATQLSDVRSRLLEARAQLPALEQRLERTTIRAPVAGQIVGLKVHTLGGVISPGEPLMGIVPRAEDLLVRARVAPADIDNVTSGQDVRLRFSALGTSLVEAITGEVQSVSADTLRQEEDGTRYYLARIRVSEEGLETLRREGLILQAGMPVTAMIQTGERTMLSYMLRPISDMMARSMREP
ncbi:MAG: HlyD family type I secretion periplasmic adaptor subunit [Gammaproteobacteria bacterium]|nr:HlyD family type I secretion periplasmic adaptor subunit [Gammaproteobacteria bacterium]